MNRFGARIREARIARGWSLDRLARQAGTFKGYCSGIETGSLRPPSPDVIRRLCKALRLRAEDMLALAWFEKRPAGVSTSALNDVLTSALAEEWAVKRSELKPSRLLKARGITVLPARFPKGPVR